MFLRTFRAQSIERKFTSAVMLVAGVALTLSLAVYLIQETREKQAASVHESLVIGDLVATGSLAALTFEDAVLAEKCLAILGNQDQVQAAVLYRRDGQRLASRGALDDQITNKPFKEGVVLQSRRLIRDETIRMQGEEVGRLRLVLRLEPLWTRLGWALGAALLIGGSSFALALALTGPIRKHLIIPIRNLAHTAREVAQQHDYSLRVPTAGKDQLGQLLVDFNGMLAQIQATDQQLRQHHEHLEKLVEERTRELSEAMVKAEAGSKAKGEFLATMSHEIRTPLNGILGLSTLLLDAPMAPRERRLAEKVGVATEALLTVLGNVLDFSRLEAGKVVLQTVAFDPERLALDLAEVVALGAATKGLDMSVEVTPEVPAALLGDPSRLSQVLLNLLGNAVKFTDQGSVTLRVVGDPDHSGHWRFEVLDSGPGIPPEKVQLLFAPFTQADGSFSRRHGGSGLGLSISQSLAQLMGGTLLALPRPEGGTCFRLTLPLEPTDKSLAVPSQMVGRVLLLGSLPATLRSLQQQLRAQGLEVHLPSDPTVFPAADSDTRAPWDLVVVAAIPGHPPDLMEHLVAAAGAIWTGPNPPWLLCTPSHASAPAGQIPYPAFQATLTVPASRTNLARAIEAILPGHPPVAPASAVPMPPTRFQMIHASQGRRILVVDDNDLNRDVFAEILAHMGHQAETAEDGHQALSLYLEQPFDLVLMDCQMPTMDGFESTRRIRGLGGAGATVPIVALTGNAGSEDLRRCLESGMNDVLTKPVQVSDLQAMIEKWLPLVLRAEAL